MGNFSNQQRILYVVIFGSVKGVSGTPIRINRWIGALKQLDIPHEVITFDSMPEKEILSYLNSKVRKEDIIFTLNHYGVFKIRKLIKTIKPNVIVDIHGLQSIEIFRNYLRKLKFKLLENFVNFVILKNRITSITVCNQIARINLLNLGKRNFVVQGGLNKLNPTKINELKINPSVQIISYIGNGREYQGIHYLIETITSSNFLKTNNAELFTLIDGTLTIYKHNAVQKILSIDQHQSEWLMCNSSLLVIPRPETKISRYSFPSKVYDYLSSGTNIVASNAFEKLPKELEISINRFKVETHRDVLDALTNLLKNAKFNRCKHPDVFDDLYARYSWDAQLSQIINYTVEE